MARGCILLASAGRIAAWLRRGGSVGIDAEFVADDQGFAAFAGYLAQHRNFDFTMLADLADEEFESQDLPPLRGRDRRTLVARKLEQIHAGSPLRAAIACGRRRDGRRDERVLFAALPQPPALTRWLQALEDADAALAGVVSAAQLIERLPSLRAQALPYRLVVTATRAGLRQTLLENGRLRLSRLTPASADADLPKTCAAEASRLRQYLVGRALADDAVLPVAVLAESRQAESYRAACAEAGRLRVDLIDAGDECRRLGVRLEAPLPVRTEALFVELLARRRPAQQFAPASFRRDFMLRRAERALGRAALLSLCAGVAVGALQWSQARQLHAANAASAALVAADARRYEARLQALPPLPVPAARLDAVLERYEQLQRQSPQPAAAYRLLGEALDEFPQVFVERLDWKLDDGKSAELELHASLPPTLAGDLRGQLAVVDGLKRRLEAASVGVQILRPPFDADPAQPLASKTVVSRQRPAFSLRLLLPAS